MKNDIDSKIVVQCETYKNIILPKDKIVELDIGCGKGSFTTQVADMYPDSYVMAIDVLIGRLRKLAKRNNRYNVQNMHLYKADAWNFICHDIPDCSIDRLHILCPDPWPKARHKRHRLLSSEFIHRMSLKLKKNGVFHFSTDDKPYWEFVTTNVNNSELFIEDESAIKDIRNIKSDFELLWESKGLKVNHVAYVKK